MSLSKPIKDNLMRDSFSDRFCDDLSEDILQYLPLKDKLRLESVSKRFQKSISERLYDLDINLSVNQSSENLEKFLKKRTKIRSITRTMIFFSYFHLMEEDFNDYKINFQFYNRFIDSIINNCDNLSQFECLWKLMSDENRIKFIEKFKSKITYLWIVGEIDPKILDSFPNLEVLDFHSYNPDPSVFVTKFKNLKKFCSLLDTKCTNNFHIFVNNHKTTLKYLKLDVTSIHHKLVFNQISNLNQLIELNIRVNKGINDNSLAEPMNQLSLNCRKLKSISCNVFVLLDSTQISNMSQVLSLLKEFNQLKRLELIIDINTPNKKFSKSFMESIFKDFEGFQSLELLKIQIIGSGPQHNRETSLTDIDINLPNLRYFEIKNAVIEVNESTVESLSRLSRLESFKIVVNNKSIGDQIKEKLIQNCKRIRSVSIDFDNWYEQE